MFLIQDANAADAVSSAATSATTAGDSTFSIIMMVAMIVIFYFLLWRPQSKRAKEHRNLVGNLQKDDEIVTSGGIIGRITKVEEKFLTIAIANNVEIRLQRSAVTSVLPKGSV